MTTFASLQLWEDSKLHNVQLQKELNEVKSDLESVRSQLETMAIRVSKVPASRLQSRAQCLRYIDTDTDTDNSVLDPFLEINLTSCKLYFQAVNQKSVSDAEKREKLIVIKKLEGLEKELKVCCAILKFKLTNQQFLAAPGLL